MSRSHHEAEATWRDKPITGYSTYAQRPQYFYLIKNDVLEKTAVLIETQRFVACGAFFLYPLLGLMFRSRGVAAYSFVCSSWHIMYAYNLEKQMNDYMLTNYRSLMVQHVGEKYRIHPYGIHFEDKSLWNFYYSTFKDDFIKSANSPYIELDEANLGYVNEILAYRRNRFKAVLSTLMAYKISSHVVDMPCGFINAFLFSALLFLQSQQLGDIKFSINDANHRYFFVDFAGNINFTNNSYGFRKRYLTNGAFDFAEKRSLQISSGEPQKNAPFK